MSSLKGRASLSAATTGNGTTIDFGEGRGSVSAVVAPSGTVTGGEVSILASHDGTVWVRLYTFPLRETKVRSNNFEGGAYRYWRADVYADITGGGNVTVTFMEADGRIAGTGSYAFSLVDQVGSATAYNYLSLFNPAGSGKTLVFKNASVSSWSNGGITGAGAMVCKRTTAASAGTLKAGSDVAKFSTAHADPVAVVRTGNPTVTAGAAFFASSPVNQNPGTSPVHDVSTPDSNGPFTLEEGEGIVFTAASSDVDMKWNITTIWIEV